ncbi:unnamed protein product [Rhizophagus irregularis]|uniref:Uncharacterized protein n=1 Tax=Rhizophagus irregularis TaxID=588596 RepID=A0A2I1HA98_9GLOM|nr:hypothetical protein RhiirA4_475547 [Rhizophagus irregularis]CAB4426930.1 unnamed protein product [Rhizophagus irregularis]
MTVLCSNVNTENPGNVGNRADRLTEQECHINEHCVDFTLSNAVPFAICVPERKLLAWTNGNRNREFCSGTIELSEDDDGGQVTIGLTTYATNGLPIQVFGMVGKVNDVQVGKVSNRHNYSQIIDYKAHDLVRFCFTPGISNPNDETFANEADALGYIAILSQIEKVAHGAQVTEVTDIETVISQN